MKINPGRLEAVLRLLSADKAIDPLKMKFSEKGVEVCQTDRATVIASIGRMDSAAFADYEPIGEITLNVADILGKIPKMFREDKEISVFLESPSISFRGDYEYFSSILSSEEVESEIAFAESPHGFVLTKPKVTNIYSVDPANVGIGFGEFIRFKYEPDSLKISVSGDTFSYEKRLRTLRAQGSESGELLLDIESFENIVKMFKEQFTLIFTEGPLMITYKEADISVTYAIAPRSA